MFHEVQAMLLEQIGVHFFLVLLMVLELKLE